MTRRVIFEKTLTRLDSTQPFVIRMVSVEYPDSESFYIEKLERYDAMNNPVWMPIENTSLSLVFDTFGEYFKDINLSDFQSHVKTVEENLKLKNIFKKILAMHFKKEENGIDFETTWKGERVLIEITKAIFNDFYIDDTQIEELIKNYSDVK